VTRAYLGMGSNLGDRVAALAAALDALDGIPGVRVIASSSVYESEPWGVTDQPAFANAVAAIETSLTASQLLAAAQLLEALAGRVTGPRNGPRPLDLDLLLFGGETSDAPEFTVPHPRLLERDFVITPLLEIAPGLRMPDGRPVTREAVTAGRVTGVLAPPLRDPTA
jgi:2-amino-4-hydroxy-6-hydroxymethyldihydropteridine diphosphokinase